MSRTNDRTTSQTSFLCVLVVSCCYTTLIRSLFKSLVSISIVGPWFLRYPWPPSSLTLSWNKTLSFFPLILDRWLDCKSLSPGGDCRCFCLFCLFELVRIQYEIILLKIIRSSFHRTLGCPHFNGSSDSNLPVPLHRWIFA